MFNSESQICSDVNKTSWEGRAVLLVDLDAFFASVEQLDHPMWRGKPVIVGGDPKKHGVVSTASYEARAFGVKSAMPSSMAHQLCPQAIWTSGHFDRYHEMSSHVMNILMDESPFMQQVSIDEAFLDVTPTLPTSEHPVSIAQRIQKRVSEFGITCSIGVGTSKTIAKIASNVNKPQGITVIYPGQEIEFLSPLPVRQMSGIGAKAQDLLSRKQIFTLGQLAEASDRTMTAIFGKNAETMRKRALGLDTSPVASTDDIKSISNEMTLAEDARSFGEIDRVMGSMAAKVGRRMRAHELKGATLTLKIRFSDRTLKTAQRKLQEPTDNERECLPILRELLQEIWSPGMPVRLIGVSLSSFEQDFFQQSLIVDEEAERAKEKNKKLAKTSDLLKNKFGEKAVFYGREYKVMDKSTGTGAKNPTQQR